jgi:hypothetical protein
MDVLSALRFRDLVSKHVKLAALVWRYGGFRRRLKRDPDARNYTDIALTPVDEDRSDEMELAAGRRGKVASSKNSGICRELEDSCGTATFGRLRAGSRLSEARVGTGASPVPRSAATRSARCLHSRDRCRPGTRVEQAFLGLRQELPKNQRASAPEVRLTLHFPVY